MNISKLMTLIFRNRTIFWDIPKWNRGQTKWDRWSINLKVYCRVKGPNHILGLEPWLRA